MIWLVIMLVDLEVFLYEYSSGLPLLLSHRPSKFIASHCILLVRLLFRQNIMEIIVEKVHPSIIRGRRVSIVRDKCILRKFEESSTEENGKEIVNL